jgi:hypothetical protein
LAVVTPRAVDAGATAELLLAVATDYVQKSELAAVNLGTRGVRRATFGDGDAVPAASGGMGFVLERTNDKVHVLDAAGNVARSIDLHGAASGASATQKAYVLLYATNRIAVVDLDAGRVAQYIDLSALHAAGDMDGAVDMDDIVYDPASARAYVALGRIDRTTILPPSFELACPSWKGLVVGIDTTTDTLVDVNGSAAGQAAELSLVSPSGLHLDSEQERLLVLQSGCFRTADAGSERVGYGVEAVNLTNGATEVLLAPDTGDFLNRLVPVGGGQALINSFDAVYEEHWHRWTLTSGALGTELTEVPAMPSYDGAGALLGIALGTTPEVVRYVLQDGATTTVVSDPWSESFPAVGGTALVR